VTRHDPERGIAQLKTIVGPLFQTIVPRLGIEWSRQSCLSGDGHFYIGGRLTIEIDHAHETGSRQFFAGRCYLITGGCQRLYVDNPGQIAVDDRHFMV